MKIIINMKLESLKLIIYGWYNGYEKGHLGQQARKILLNSTFFLARCLDSISSFDLPLPMLTLDKLKNAIAYFEEWAHQNLMKINNE